MSRGDFLSCSTTPFSAASHGYSKVRGEKGEWKSSILNDEEVAMVVIPPSLAQASRAKPRRS